MMRRFLKPLFCASVLIVAAACASTPEENEGMTIYVDPETGQASVDEDASDDAKLLADLMGQAMRGELKPDLPDEEIWAFDAKGNATHLQSGMICPVQWGDMSRAGEVTVFKQTGMDVGCNYTNGAGAIFTMYAYRNGMSVTDELDTLMTDVVRARTPVHEESSMFTAPGNPSRGFSYIGDAITYSDVNSRSMKTGVFLMNADVWRFKLRVTYLNEEAGQKEAFAGMVMMGQFDRMTGFAAAQDAGKAAPSPIMPDASEIEA
jgi:hypothetical protein